MLARCCLTDTPQATYAAAKAALIAFTKGIAHEGSPYITANVVCPGPTNPDPRHLREPDPPIAEDGSANWLGDHRSALWLMTLASAECAVLQA